MAFLTALALVLLLAGTYLLSQQLYVWDAGLFVALALGLLVTVAVKQQGRRGSARGWAGALLPQTAAGWFRHAAVGLSALVALSARSRPLESGFGSLLSLWIFAVGLFLVTTTTQLIRRCPIRWANHRSEVVALGALLMAAGLLRVVALGRVPANLGGDEGTQLADALTLVSAPLGNPFATGWYSVPTMSFLAYGVGMRLFGATVAGGRVLSALIGTATVATTYLLARALSGRRAGWLAAALVAFSAYHIHFSRLASNQIGDPLIGTLTLWLVWRGLGYNGGRALASGAEVSRSKTSAIFIGPSAQALWLGLAGVAAGLGWYGYFGARWITILVGLIVGWRSLAAPLFVRRHWRGLLLFAAGWMVVTLPLLGWYSAHPSSLTERYNAVSIFASGWLAREVEITGRGPIALMLQQLWRSITAFHLTHDPTFWYFPQRPLLDFVTGGFMLMGMVEAIVRWKWPSRAMTLLWFGSTLMMAWVLTENPPSSQRGLLMVPAAALLAAWGVDWAAGHLVRGKVALRWWYGSWVALVMVVNCVFYFGIYTPARVYGNPTAEIATAFARHTLAHPEPVCPPGATSPSDCPGMVYFLGPPRLEWDFGALRFMLRHVPGIGVAEGEVPRSIDRPARFAFVPERAVQLAEVQELYPGGQRSELLGPEGRLLMVIYDWQPGA
ncbi:MAG: glycosyltransferase family 39 protein [Anaerolineae bacterium]|nr:glycosyltransferase family 39 protein [Anaerolineae bacterium]